LTSDIIEKTCVVYILLLQKQKRNQKIPCSDELQPGLLLKIFFSEATI